MQAESWLRLDAGEYIARGACGEEDEILLTLCLTRSAANRFHPRRILYEMSDDLWELYSTRKAAAEEANV